MTYLDTSAFMAIIDPGDNNNGSAIKTWRALLASGEMIVTSSYVFVETVSLMHKRYGKETVRRFTEDILPIIDVDWADQTSNTIALSAMLATMGKSGPSIVDCMSFEVIGRRGITQVFAYDKHFSQRGYTVIG